MDGGRAPTTKERRNEGTSDASYPFSSCDYSISAKNSMVLLSASMKASTSSGRL